MFTTAGAVSRVAVGSETQSKGTYATAAIEFESPLENRELLQSMEGMNVPGGHPGASPGALGPRHHPWGARLELHPCPAARRPIVNAKLSAVNTALSTKRVDNNTTSKLE